MRSAYLAHLESISRCFLGLIRATIRASISGHHVY